MGYCNSLSLCFGIYILWVIVINNHGNHGYFPMPCHLLSWQPWVFSHALSFIIMATMGIFPCLLIYYHGNHGYFPMPCHLLSWQPWVFSHALSFIIMATMGIFPCLVIYYHGNHGYFPCLVIYYHGNHGYFPMPCHLLSWEPWVFSY